MQCCAYYSFDVYESATKSDKILSQAYIKRSILSDCKIYGHKILPQEHKIEEHLYEDVYNIELFFEVT